MFLFSGSYLVIFVLTLVISIAAQLYISSAYKKWGKVRNNVNMTGTQIGELIVDRTTLGDSPIRPSMGSTGGQRGTGEIRFGRVGGQLTDNYDPRSNTVHLSDGVANSPSVAAMAIVAHELGHAQQHEQRSFLISIRNVLVPAVTISPRIAFLLIFAGLLLNMIQLFWIGVLFYGIMVLFTIFTLPVEIDASRRGLHLLREANLMQTETDESGARNVLTAAAGTYVAAAVTAILQMLYFISLGRRRS